MSEMQDNGLQPDEITYTGVISACVAAGQLQQAHRYLREMQSLNMRAYSSTYTSMVLAYSKSKQPEQHCSFSEK